MDLALVVAACLLALVGWVVSLAGLSGTWLILVAAVGADLAIDREMDFLVSAIVFAVLCLAAEVVEFLSGLLGAKAFGGSRWAQVGAFLGTVGGGVAGSAVFPVLGTIVGVLLGGFVGSLVGELLYQDRTKGAKPALAQGAKAGLGAVLARAFSIAIKASLSTIMVGWLVLIIVMEYRG